MRARGEGESAVSCKSLTVGLRRNSHVRITRGDSASKSNPWMQNATVKDQHETKPNGTPRCPGLRLVERSRLEHPQRPAHQRLPNGYTALVTASATWPESRIFLKNLPPAGDVPYSTLTGADLLRRQQRLGDAGLASCLTQFQVQGTGCRSL